MRRRMGVWAITVLLSPAAGFAQTPSPPDAKTPAVVEPLFAEPRLLASAMARLAKRGGASENAAPKDGFYAELGHMITGSGWISAGPGYRQRILGGRGLFDTSAAISWRAYKIAQARVEFPAGADDRFTVGSKVLWQDFTQVRYFGRGPDSRADNVSDFRVRATDIVGYADWRPRETLTVSGTLGWLTRPTIATSAGTFDRNDPDVLPLHATDPAASAGRQPSYLHTELAVAADTRDHPSYPRQGGVARAAWSAFHDRDSGQFSFDRYETEGAYFVPVLGHGVLAARVWGVFSGTRDGREVPFYMLPSLGGHNTLRGYADYRFHDRHMIVANLESRWALFEHVDGAVFVDAGSVAATIGDLNFGRTSYGAGLRLHSATSTLARFDVGHSAEGWRVMFKLSDPLRIGRSARRTAALPFVP